MRAGRRFRRSAEAARSGASRLWDELSRPGRAQARRGFPIVGRDDGASRALVAVTTILAFLAALAAGTAAIVAASSADWRAAVAREATIQVRPVPGRDIAADTARAAALARAAPGIAEVRLLDAAEAEALLAPWLGSGLDLSELPVPHLVALRFGPAGAPDLSALRAGLAAVPGASLDDHAAWNARLSVMAATVVAAASAFVALVLAAAALAVGFATRGAMAGNRDVVEVLHFVGASDGFVAREFALRFARLGFAGGLLGAGAAAVLVAGAGALLGGGGRGPSDAQLEALFGSFRVGPGGYAAMAAIAVLTGVVSGLVSRLTARRFLKDQGRD